MGDDPSQVWYTLEGEGSSARNSRYGASVAMPRDRSPRRLCLTNFIHHGLMGPTPVVNSGTWSVGFNDEASVSCSVLNGVQSLSFSSFQEALAMQCPPVPALWLLSFFHLDLLHTSPNTVPSTISTTSHLPVTLHCGLELKSFLYFESRKQLCQFHGGSDPM